MRALPLLLLLPLAVACDEAPDDVDDTTPPEPVTFARVQEEVFVPSCGGAGCHGEVTQAGELVLKGPEAYASLTEDPCAHPQAVVEGLLRVDTEDLENSFLWTKVTDPGGMGDPMPPWGGLTDAQIDLIEQWILDGALP